MAFFFGAAQGTLAGGLRVHAEHEGEVRPEVPKGELAQGVDVFRRDATADALVDGSGVEEAIADDDATLIEGGADDVEGQLCAAGAEEKDFGRGTDVHFRAGELEDVAHSFAQRGAARFARDEEGDAVLFEFFDEVMDLSCFARALAAFEGDEFGCHARAVKSRRVNSDGGDGGGGAPGGVVDFHGTLFLACAVGGVDLHHGVEASFEARGRGGVGAGLEALGNVEHLDVEIVGAFFGEDEVFWGTICGEEAHEVARGMTVGMPFDATTFALDEAPFFGGGGDDVLDDAADAAICEVGVHGEEVVVFGFALLFVGDCGFELGDFAGAAEVGEVLEEVNRVGVFAACAAAAVGVAKVGLPGAFEPGVGFEDAAPEFAEFDVPCERGAEVAAADEFGDFLCALGEGVIVADEAECAGGGGFAFQVGESCEVGGAEGFFDEEGARLFREGLACKGDVDVRGGADDDEVEARAGCSFGSEEFDGIVPCAVAGGVDFLAGAPEGGRVGVNDGDVPAHAPGGLGEVIADGSGTEDFDVECLHAGIVAIVWRVGNVFCERVGLIFDSGGFSVFQWL